MKQKQAIRIEMKDVREGLAAEFIKTASNAVIKSFIEANLLTDIRNVLCYLPLNNEVDTHQLIDDLVALDKKVFVPSYDKDKEKYICALFNGWDTLTIGPYDVLQPIDSHEIDVSQIELAILPGIAFDTKGFRLGYGKGVYDKLLSGSVCTKIGFVYDFQMVEKLPFEAHDLKMDMVITEKRVISL